MIVVDSSVWIAHLRNQDRPAVRLLRSYPKPGRIIVGDVVLLEVLRGARDHRDAARIERGLREFRIERMLDDSTAVAAASHYRTLRQAGVTIRKTVDLIIATFCLTHDYELLHDDRDFERCAARLGLRVVDTSSIATN